MNEVAAAAVGLRGCVQADDRRACVLLCNEGLRAQSKLFCATGDGTVRAYSSGYNLILPALRTTLGALHDYTAC
jgi:hypothetical protein